MHESLVDISDSQADTPVSREPKQKHNASDQTSITSHSNTTTTTASQSPPVVKNQYDIIGYLRIIWYRYRVLCCLIIWILITAYFIVSLALKKKTQTSDILPFIFLYVFVSGKIFFTFNFTRRVVSTVIIRPLGVLSDRFTLVWEKLPKIWRYLFGLVVLLSIMLSVSLSAAENGVGKRIDRMQSFLGIIIITLGMVLTSKHPKHIQWPTIIVGYLMQFCLGCIVIKTKWGQDLFSWLAHMASELLGFSSYGTKFLLGDDVGSMTTIFAITVFPAIIFFAAFIQVIYYLGGMQWLLKKIGWLFYKTMGVSGSESIVAASSPFIGQAENVLMAKDYILHMTNSEIHACMTAGFATVSGSTLQGYIVLGVDPKNIITACIMSIPCSLALSKIRFPETQESLTRGKMADPPRTSNEANVLHALGNGAALGINLSLLIFANLVAIIAMVHLVNFLLTWLGQFITIDSLTIELILGYLLYPFTWLLGVPSKDVLKVSQLLGLKFVGNEFVAYQRLNDTSNGPSVSSMLSVRGRTIAEFALCGFGNLGSIAMQIGSLGSLAPARKGDFSRLALSACITGSIATCMSAAIISMVM